MMIGPEGYIDRLKDASYPELIKEREQLLRRITDFEEKEMAGDRSGEEWLIKPSPDVHYQMELEYLGELCRLMAEKYNREYVSDE